MADSKISALSDGTPIVATDAFVIARGGGNDKILGGKMPGFEFDFVSTTTDLTVTATSAASAQSFIDGAAVSYDGSTRIKIEFYCPNSVISSGVGIIELYDGSTDLFRMGQGTVNAPIYIALFLTPSNASHTYHIKAWKSAGSFSLSAGGGGIYQNAWYRITKA